MGRALRIVDPNSIYHVISRGNNRGPIVWDEPDRASFRDEFAAVALRWGWDVLAWCLMTTHYHALVRARHGGLSEGMQALNGNHSRRTNHRYGRTGHLFQNRFFSVEVASDAHLVGALLYVARNPVAAGVCSDASQWSDSSYRATVGLDRAPRWLMVEDVLRLFGRSRDE